MNSKGVSKVPIDLLFLGTVMLFAFGVKLFYTQCDTDQLKLFLKPVSLLISFFTGASFQFNGEEGYLFNSLNIAIERSCSGVNFFVLSFCMITFSSLPFHPTAKQKAYVLLLSVIACWGVTIVANSSRILVAINALKWSKHYPWLSTDQAHLAQGVFTYLSFLIAFYFLALFFNKKIINAYA